MVVVAREVLSLLALLVQKVLSLLALLVQKLALLAVVVVATEVLSLLALLVQKYKYGHLWSCVPAATLAGAGGMACVYLLYWYKNTNTDT